jgi:hypothetical protein
MSSVLVLAIHAAGGSSGVASIATTKPEGHQMGGAFALAASTRTDLIPVPRLSGAPQLT